MILVLSRLDNTINSNHHQQLKESPEHKCTLARQCASGARGFRVICTDRGNNLKHKPAQMFTSYYRNDLDKSDLDSFAKMLHSLNHGERVFLLCFENLNKTYTKTDEKKYSDVKAGEKKKCHRTILADVLNKNYGFNIAEYDG